MSWVLQNVAESTESKSARWGNSTVVVMVGNF